MEASKLGDMSLVDLADGDPSLTTVKPISLAEIEVLASIRDKKRRLSVISRIQNWEQGNKNSSVIQLRQLLAVEDIIEPVIKSDKNWFFSSPDLPDQSQFAIDLDLYHLCAAATYQRLIDRRGEWEKGADSLLHSAVAFALFHYGSAIKWGFLRHRPTNPTLWLRLHSLYSFAENESFATIPVSLSNPEAGKQTTITAIFLRALLLDTLNSGSLSAEQVEIADSWLTDWSSQYALDSVLNPALHILSVDLMAASGASRVMGKKSSAGLRYLRLAGIELQISKMQNELREGHQSQDGSEAIQFPVTEYAGLLGKIEQLHRSILQPDSQQVESRTPVLAGKLADIRVGISAVLRALSAVAEPFSAEKKNTKPVKQPKLRDEIQWQIQDLSASGMGLIVERNAAEKLAIGEIILVKPPEHIHYQLATIARKLTRPNASEMLLGVEIISLRPVLMTLYCKNANDTTTALQSIYAPGKEPDGRHDALIMDASQYVPRTPYAIKTQSGLFAVRIRRLSHKSATWVGLRFEVTSKA